MSKKSINEFQLLPIAAAILLAYSNAYAEEKSEVHDLITPGSSVSIGIGGVNNAKDAKRFSEYTGLNGTAGLVDFELNSRDAATGFWTSMSGRNLGLESRELNFSQSKQGNWKYAIDYNEMVRLDPYIINTGMTGIGSTTPTINLIAQPAMPAAWATGTGSNALVAPASPAQANDVELKLNRTALGLKGEKWISPELQFEMSLRYETKKGSRMFGRAGLDSSDMTLRPNATGASANGGWAVLLVPEPIDSSIRQLEAKLNFNRDKLALTGAYYGSFYANNNGSLSPIVPGTLNRGALWTNCATAGCSTVPQLASAAVALPPDNQAHQFYVTGNYAFTQDTRGNFKVSYAHATQNESFVGMGLTPATNAPANLGGVVDTKLAQVGLTSKVTSNLSVNGSLRYEDRADKTPKAVYNTSYGVPCGTTTAAVGSALNCTSNWPSGSQTRTSAKLDGVYRMISGYMLTVGGDWERKATPLPPDNTALFNAQVLFRSALVETGLHTEIRKSLSETLNGALGVEVKKRRGKDTGWVTTSGTAANTLVLFDPTLNVSASNRVLPDMYMDRDRTKLRGSLDWDASDKLLVQGVVEHSRDAYLRAYSEAYLATQVIPTVPGARTIMADSLSLESSYQASENWKVNGYWTRSYNRWNVNKASLGDDTKNTANTFGMGINGKLSPRITVGLALLTTRDNTSYSNLSATAVAGQAAGNVAGWVGQTQPGNTLPDIKYTTNKLNIQGNYAIDKASDVRLLLAYQEFKTDDWQWGYNGVPFLYSDNTTVSQPNQYLSFIGASYIIRY